MPKGSTFANETLEHILNNADIPLIGDAAGLLQSATDGNLYLSLHSSDPGIGGDQTTNEITYTGYARVAVARTGSLWTVTGNVAVNAGAITFGERTDVGSVSATHVAIGTASTGAGKILYTNALTTGLAITQNVQPNFPAGDIDLTET